MMADIRAILAEGDCTLDELQAETGVKGRRLHDLVAVLIREGHAVRAGKITKKVVMTRHMILYRLTPRGTKRAKDARK